MCENYECKKRTRCYRYRAKPSQYCQSYALFNSEGNKTCDFFWPVNIRKEGKYLRALEEADAVAKRIREQIEAAED